MCENEVIREAFRLAGALEDTTRSKADAGFVVPGETAAGAAGMLRQLGEEVTALGKWREQVTDLMRVHCEFCVAFGHEPAGCDADCLDCERDCRCAGCWEGDRFEFNIKE